MAETGLCNGLVRSLFCANLSLIFIDIMFLLCGCDTEFTALHNAMVGLDASESGSKLSVCTKLVN